MRKNFQSSSRSLLFIKTSTITAISERKQQQQQNIGHATSKSVIRCFHKHRFVFEEDLKQMQLNEPGGKKLERQNFWQKVKHTNWYPDRLQALIRESL